MKYLISKLLTAAVLPVSAFAINTYNIFTDTVTDIQFYQPGGLVEITNSYVFDAGVISGSNFSAPAIAANFISMGFTSNWDSEMLGTGIGAASISLAFDGSYPTGVNVGAQIYFWGFDSKALVADSDWIVITNPTWLVRPLVTGAAVDSIDYTISDPGTIYVFGSLDGNRATLAPIPEPSSFAAIAGLSVFGLVAARRRRSV